MVDFIFPKTGAHCVTINGLNLIFSPGMGIPLLVNKAAFGLVKRCSGMSLTKAQEWLRERYGEESVYIADEFRKIIGAGYFSEPQLDFAESDADMPMPTSYGIGITHKCNMRCRYCFAAGARKCDEPEDISLDTARAAINFLFDTLQPPWVRIELGITGEPLLRWNALQDVIGYARKKSAATGTGVGFSITTNGLELNREMLDYLRAHGDTKITLSWDGPREVHNRQRLSPDGIDTYERVSSAFENLRDCIESRSSVPATLGCQPGPTVVATVSALNPDVAAVFTHLFDKGVRDLVIKPARVAADPAIAITEENLLAFKAGYTNLAKLLLKHDDAQAERLFTLLTVGDFLGRRILSISNNARMACRCNAARTHFEVDTNGDIYPCPSLVGMTDFRMGNVHTGLEDNKAKSFREDTFCSNLQACSNCWAKYLCGGPCAYVSAVTSGRPDIPYGPECELTKHLIELAGYIVARLRVERPGLLEQVLALRSREFDLGTDTAAEPVTSAVGG